MCMLGVCWIYTTVFMACQPAAQCWPFVECLRQSSWPVSPQQCWLSVQSRSCQQCFCSYLSACERLGQKLDIWRHFYALKTSSWCLSDVIFMLGSHGRHPIMPWWRHLYAQVSWTSSSFPFTINVFFMPWSHGRFFLLDLNCPDLFATANCSSYLLVVQSWTSAEPKQMKSSSITVSHVCPSGGSLKSQGFGYWGGL